MEEQPDERTWFTVTDLKQYVYCARVVFYTYCMPLLRPTTYKMEAGVEAHADAGVHERRRTLAAYGLQEGRRHFDVPVASQRLGLRGRIDMVIETGDKASAELMPVDYKHSARQVGPHVRRQLAAYGMMLKETTGSLVRRGFVYSLVTRHAVEVALTASLRASVEQTVEAMREMVTSERLPEPPPVRLPCLSCEFRRFCNDVL